MSKANRNELRSRKERLMVALTEVQDAADGVLAAIKDDQTIRQKLVVAQMLLEDLTAIEGLVKTLEAREADARGWL